MYEAHARDMQIKKMFNLINRFTINILQTSQSRLFTVKKSAVNFLQRFKQGSQDGGTYLKVLRFTVE